jgi:hypothetical protein
VFLREGYAGHVTPHRVLLVVPITSFLSSAWGLAFKLFDVCTEALLQLQWEHWVSVHCGDRPSSTSRGADCQTVEELGFHLLDRKDMTLLPGGTV